MKYFIIKLRCKFIFKFRPFETSLNIYDQTIRWRKITEEEN